MQTPLRLLNEWRAFSSRSCVGHYESERSRERERERDRETEWETESERDWLRVAKRPPSVCSLLDDCFLLSSDYCLLSAVCWLLSTVCRLLLAVCFLMLSWWDVLLNTRWTSFVFSLITDWDLQEMNRPEYLRHRISTKLHLFNRITITLDIRSKHEESFLFLIDVAMTFLLWHRSHWYHSLWLFLISTIFSRIVNVYQKPCHNHYDDVKPLASEEFRKSALLTQIIIVSTKK